MIKVYGSDAVLRDYARSVGSEATPKPQQGLFPSTFLEASTEMSNYG